MAQMMRAVLLASATAASFFGLRASNPNSHDEARPVGLWPAGLPRGLACWITAVAPNTSNRGKSSSPCRLILPGRDFPAVESSRGVMPIQAAKCRAERKALMLRIIQYIHQSENVLYWAHGSERMRDRQRG